MNYTGKKILVIGAGTSGIGAAHVLGKLGAQVVLNDLKAIDLEPTTEAKLKDLGVSIITGRQDESLLEGMEMIVVSPGLPLTIPILLAAKESGIPVVGEVEVAYQVSKAPILGVTGTNGKTTTTTLLADVMKGTDSPVYVGGNIGDSLTEAAFAVPENGVLVAELSSYQLESIHSFKAHGAIVLNLTPDHLARHKTMDGYRLAKENIFKNQGPSDFVVLNLDDPIVAGMKDRATGKVLCISQKEVVTDGAYFAGATCYAVKDGQAQPIISKNEIPIPGAHNVENILSVIALTYALGVEPEVIHDAIANFKTVEHRLERVDTIDGVTYYNDSKATNTDSVEKALASFDQKVILLMGGHDKMTPLNEFMKVVKDHTKDLILMGEAADRFEAAARDVGIESIHRASSMGQAVNLGRELGQKGDVVLLSPACSSFDWYSCFEERGCDFKREVLRLKGE